MNTRTIRKTRRGPAPKPPKPADVSAEALIEAVHVIGDMDRTMVTYLTEWRVERRRLLRQITEAINAQRAANGHDPLSDTDRVELWPDLKAAA